MNALRISSGAIALLLLFALASPVNSQSGITINGADSNTDLTTGANAGLSTTLSSMNPRIMAIPANTLQLYSLQGIPIALANSANQVGARFTFIAANSNDRQVLVYPALLINDMVAPQISGVGVTPVGNGTIRVNWITDEWATSVVDYGSQPGQYTQTMSSTLYLKLHTIWLSGLTVGDRYYFRVRSMDRNNNSAQSSEASFVPPYKLFLPLIKR